MASDKSIVLITGGNGGIGYLTAEALSASSSKYHVIIGSRSVEKGQKALSELQARFPKSSISLLQLDVTDQKSIADAVASVTKDFGRLDVLINNAGIISHGDTLEKQLRETFETNTFGPALVTDAFQSLLEKSSDARLIYVSSILGSVAGKCDPNSPWYKIPLTAYRMSKAALNMLMACNQADLGPKGFKVWAFDPGYVVTNLNRTGEKGRQEMIKNGAGDASVSAKALADVVEGKRDADVGKHVHKDGIHLW